MSFFRNLRSSITRGRSSSRDTTPVRTSRPGSVISSLHSGSSKRRDSIESRSDSLLNRSDTFILDDPDATPCHSNCSTLEKKSKKSKVLEKFSTFTKRKKNPASDKVTFEHHPSDNATNTYYKWQAEEGGNSLDYDCQNDPFNLLYQQQSSLKATQNKAGSLEPNSSPVSSSFDSSTYRKSKMPTEFNKQLKTLKEPEPGNLFKRHVAEVDDENEEEDREDNVEGHKKDKYKTVTLNSFRRSFRDKFLQQQQKEAAHNPAWFVEVDKPELKKNQIQQRDTSKENRNDLLVFENENFRPGSRSPIRDFYNRKEARNATRSPVKRNETFKVERLSRFDQQTRKTKPEEHTDAIHIEFKNSITPHIPGRMVPVGVAKPMPSQLSYNNYYRKLEPSIPSSYCSIKSGKGVSTTRLNNHSPNRNTRLQTSSSPARTISSNPIQAGRFQTLVQIKNEKSQPSSAASAASASNNRLSTRIQLGNTSNTNTNLDRKLNFATQSPSFGKRYHSAQLLNQSGCKPQTLKQTFFGETPHTAKISQIPTNLSSSTSGLRARHSATTNYGGYKYQIPALFASANSLAVTTATTTAPTPPPTTTQISSRTTPSHSTSNIYASSNSNLSYHKHYQQQPRHQHQQQQQQQQQQQYQTRFAVTGQRRARSPIKIPWR